jgi:dipeptidyl aminopeptidase/acylaminoacyl peptidase
MNRDLSPAFAAELDRLVPPDETAAIDWEDVLRRVEPARAQAPRRRPHRRGVRVLIVAIAIFLLMAAIATATYLALHSGGSDEGALTIVTGASPRGDTAIAEVEPDGRLRILWRCPHPNRFCGEMTSLAWSPDGRRLAFTMDEIGGSSGYIGLHIVDTITGRDLQIPRTGLRDSTPGQSPAFFERFRRRGMRQLGCAFPVGVAWSPDSHRLAYTCGFPGPLPRSRIFVIRADGSGRRAIPTGIKASASASWSPEGRRIAFAGCTSCSAAGSSNVYVVNLDGTGRRLVARHGDIPAWSPNGRTIAYRGTCGIKLATPAGKDVTPTAAADKCGALRPRGYPAWSLDGKRIAIGTLRGVYVINANGTGRVRVTKIESGTPGFGPERPAWTPTPRVVHSRQVPPVRSPCC